MSAYVINTVDGAKRMRPVRSEEEYRASRESTRQMLKNWRNQGLIVLTPDNQYAKVRETA